MHDRAHLAGRHHLALAGAAGLDPAFGFVPLFRVAREQTAVLWELLADDGAARTARPLTVAIALLQLADPGRVARPRSWRSARPRTLPVTGSAGCLRTGRPSGHAAPRWPDSPASAYSPYLAWSC